jgi:hypothetical protein
MSHQGGDYFRCWLGLSASCGVLRPLRHGGIGIIGIIVIILVVPWCLRAKSEPASGKAHLAGP